MAGDVEHDHATQNTQDWTPLYVYTHIDAVGDPWCNLFGDYIGMRHLNVKLYVLDVTQAWGTTDPASLWIKGQDVRPTTSNEIATGTVSWTVSAGASYGPFSFGVSAQTQGSIYDYAKGWPNEIRDNHRILAAWVSVEWNPVRSNAMDATFQLKVSDMAAQSHHLDILHFQVDFELTVDETDCFTLCWSATGNEQVLYTMILGDAMVNDPSSGSADQYTELQDGTQTVSGVGGWS